MATNEQKDLAETWNRCEDEKDLDSDGNAQKFSNSIDVKRG